MFYNLIDQLSVESFITILIIITVVINVAVAIIKHKNNTDDNDCYDEEEDDDDNDCYDEEEDDDDDDCYDEEEDDDDDDCYEEVDTEPSGVVIVMEWEARKDPDADSSAPSAAILAGARYIVANIHDVDVMEWMSTYAARLDIELSDKMSARGYRISSIYSYVMSLEEYKKDPKD